MTNQVFICYIIRKTFLFRITCAKSFPGREPQLLEYAAQLVLSERVACILPVDVLDTMFVEQSDRLATGASRFCAQQ